jgi:hypothetical protein
MVIISTQKSTISVSGEHLGVSLLKTGAPKSGKYLMNSGAVEFFFKGKVENLTKLIKLHACRPSIQLHAIFSPPDLLECFRNLDADSYMKAF